MPQVKTGYATGLDAERVAAWFLRLKGYSILARRYKTRMGEIDLIIRRGRVIAFVEVKHRSTGTQAAEAIHRKSQSRICDATTLYLQKHPQYADMDVRFDAVMIAPRRWPQHIPGAWNV